MANETDFVVYLANGEPVNLLEPDPAVFKIETIAFHLSKEQRFANALPFPYSVAEHSICVSRLLETPRLKCIAILHDSAEMVIRDIPTPLKRLIDKLSRGALLGIESRILRAIFEGLGIGEVSVKEWRAVMEADKTIFALEAEAFSLSVEAAQPPPGIVFDPQKFPAESASRVFRQQFRESYAAIETD